MVETAEFSRLLPTRVFCFAAVSDKVDANNEKPVVNGDRPEAPMNGADEADLVAAEDASRPAASVSECAAQGAPHPPPVALAPRKIKRRRRKSKGYQWGPVKRKMKKPTVTFQNSENLQNGENGVAVKRKRPGRPRKIIPVASTTAPAQAEHVATKSPTQTTMDQFLLPKTDKGAAPIVTSNSNSNNANAARDEIPNATSDSGPVSASTTTDKTRVVVASVTVSPPKPRRVLSPKSALTGASDTHRRNKKASPNRFKVEPKLRRRSAIAGENFVASILLSNRSPKKGVHPEKKRSRSRGPRSGFRELRTLKSPNRPDENEKPEKDAEKATLREPASNNATGSFLAYGPHMQSRERMKSSLNTTEGTISTVAFAKPWIPALGSGASNVAGRGGSFALAHDSRFKDMSFQAASRQTFKRGANKKMRALNLQSPALTKYRDVKRREDNETSSSSDAESSSSSSAESLSDNTSDDELADARAEEGEGFDRQWRGGEKSRKVLKRKTNNPAGAPAPPISLSPIVPAPRGAQDFDVGASDSGVQSTRKTKAVEGVKRGRGRPRKYPLKGGVHRMLPRDKPDRPQPDVKTKKRGRKKKSRGAAASARLTLKVHRTGAGYATLTQQDDAETGLDNQEAAAVTTGNSEDDDSFDGSRLDPPPETTDTLPANDALAEVSRPPSPATADSSLSSRHATELAIENDGTSESDRDCDTLEREEKTLRRHGDPTLPTWVGRAQTSNGESKDGWEEHSLKSDARSPDARHEASMNSIVLDDESSFGAVFSSVANIRPASAMSSSGDLPDLANDNDMKDRTDFGSAAKDSTEETDQPAGQDVSCFRCSSCIAFG